MPLHGSSSYEGFYRMFNQVRGTRFKPESIAVLAELADPSFKIGVAPRKIGAAYTYFGQFIAHDISRIRRGDLVPTRGPVATSELVQGVSASLDLDCLYGSSIGFGGNIPTGGPLCGQFLGEPAPKPEDRGDNIENFCDLPRDRDCPELGTLIGDPRNDENFLVSRIHVLMMNFHNRIFALWLAKGVTDPFSRARREVTLLYQYVIRNDYLNKILDNVVYEQLFTLLPAYATLLRPSSGEEPQIPIEFAAACFRFGHSMVRDNYFINDDLQTPRQRTDLSLERIFELTGPGGGWEEICKKPNLHIDWGKLIDLSAYGDKRIAEISNAFDTALAQDLLNLRNEASNNRNLATRNLGRGVEVDLPCAQDVIAFLHKCFPDYCQKMKLPNLKTVCENLLNFTFDQARANAVARVNLRESDNQGDLDKEVARLQRVTGSIEGLLAKCDHWLKLPIWTYVLIEPAWLPPTQVNKKLGKLGSIIVGEVFRSLLVTTRTSIENPEQTKDENFVFFNSLNARIQAQGLPRTEVTKDNIQLSDIIKFTYDDLSTAN